MIPPISLLIEGRGLKSVIGTRWPVAILATGLSVVLSVGPAWADPTVSPSPSQSGSNQDPWESPVSEDPTTFPENPNDWTPPADWETPDESTDIPLPDAPVEPSPSISSKPPKLPTALPTDPQELGDPACTGYWSVVKYRKHPARMGKVGPNFSSYFGNGGSQTLTAGVTGTLTATATMTLEGSLSAVSLVSAKAVAGGNLATAAAVTASLTETQDVPKKYWGNAFWGATMQPVAFNSKYYGANTCRVLKDVTYTVWYPFKPAKSVGWCKWVSKESLGSRPKQCNARGNLPL